MAFQKWLEVPAKYEINCQENILWLNQLSRKKWQDQLAIDIISNAGLRVVFIKLP
ncbi:protein of unknown function [Maridesulfovibrio hydrothermalis AM13 = DSM 14728]|uniref:Uncharacterized protein n=1 Tax=Maridesulfovibrio hydrothermalis AM13 = DSM 14728 TaxID=1121451 RepID=L0RCH4_9BACT|nr:protein of unknown function [Maridesulfovibrio hydrothermalis AM13 = DSM 14728]